MNNLDVNAVKNSFADYADPFGRNLQSAGGVSRSKGFQLFAVYKYKYIYSFKSHLELPTNVVTQSCQSARTRVL